LNKGYLKIESDLEFKVFVKWMKKVKIKFDLQQAMNIQKGSRSVALLFLQAKRGIGVSGSRHSRPLCALERESVPVL
jgi:hypothetical protein